MYTSLSGTEAPHDFSEQRSWIPPASSSSRMNRLGTDEYGERRDQALALQRTAPLATGNRFVQLHPEHAFRRRVVAWDGMAAEIVQATSSERIALHFQAQLHLLGLHDEGSRRDGETFVEGLGRSRLRDTRQKLTFVPAGHEYTEWHEPTAITRIVYFYFDPARQPKHWLPLPPRLYFEDAAIANSALKLKALLESAGDPDLSYFQAVAAVLIHEIADLHARSPRSDGMAGGGLARGGLAPWQQRAVVSYIEEHLAEPISLATLARLVRLSAFYFCRAFKQSFGMPPHRYHSRRRIEHAKSLLAKSDWSVTRIASMLGFSDTSAFSTAFHKVSGHTPTSYRRLLG
jgi:AraC family transcriptional regulator